MHGQSWRIPHCSCMKQSCFTRQTSKTDGILPCSPECIPLFLKSWEHWARPAPTNHQGQKKGSVSQRYVITECSTMQQWPKGASAFFSAKLAKILSSSANWRLPPQAAWDSKLPQAQLQILTLSALLFECFTFFGKNPCTGMLAISCARNLFCCIGLSVDWSFPLYPGCHNTDMGRCANVQRLQDFLSCSWRLMTMICIAILSTKEHIQTLKRYGQYGNMG